LLRSKLVQYHQRRPEADRYVFHIPPLTWRRARQSSAQGRKWRRRARRIGDSSDMAENSFLSTFAPVFLAALRRLRLFGRSIPKDRVCNRIQFRWNLFLHMSPYTPL
jgi:hypothetical protein